MNIKFERSTLKAETSTTEFIPTNRSYKYRDYQEFSTKENYDRFCQLCAFPISELSEEEKNNINLGNVIFEAFTDIMHSYKTIKLLDSKPTMIIGDMYFTTVLVTNSHYGSYGQSGVLAFTLPEYFDFMKHYRVYVCTEKNKKYYKMSALPINIYADICKSKATTLLRVILNELAMPVKWDEDVHHLIDIHDCVHFAVIKRDKHRQEHLKNRNHNYQQKCFLPLMQDYIGFTDEQFGRYISNLNLLKDLFGYCNALWTDLDLTEDISYMSVNQLRKHIELY